MPHPYPFHQSNYLRDLRTATQPRATLRYRQRTPRNYGVRLPFIMALVWSLVILLASRT